MEKCPFGSHRVLEPKGVLPQTAWKLDNSPEIYDNEILIDVRALNIDSANFNQLKKEYENDKEKITSAILDIVKKRGKMHNPVTNSGGMLIGKVEKIGSDLIKKVDINIGDMIATLVSLTLTPLRINRIKNVKLDVEQVEIEGKAILFESGIYVKLPTDLPEFLSLAVLDVCGAPAQVARIVKKGDIVFVLGGGGKSGMLCLVQAKKILGNEGMLISLSRSKESCENVKNLDLADIILQGDATKPIDIYNKFIKATTGKLADLTINCINVSNTEMASILCTEKHGTVYFFNMSTDFTKAALGAEGVGKDIKLMIGNGYVKGAPKLALNLLRENEELRKFYIKKYS
jgi:L-erythro-3,5-diaminohexanoate dehydrogenase